MLNTVGIKVSVFALHPLVLWYREMQRACMQHRKDADPCRFWLPV